MESLIWLFVMSLLLLIITLVETIVIIEKKRKQTAESYNLTELMFCVFGLIIAIIGLFVPITAFSVYISDCPECGTLRKTNDYCITCGYNFNQEKICPNCKKDTESSSIYCGHCGDYILK